MAGRLFNSLPRKEDQLWVIYGISRINIFYGEKTFFRYSIEGRLFLRFSIERKISKGLLQKEDIFKVSVWRRPSMERKVFFKGLL